MDDQNSKQSTSDTVPASKTRMITWRSVLLGLLCVIAINAVTPYNDMVVSNSFMIGGYLPLAIVLVFFLLVVVINGPLRLLMPGRELSPGELSVILLMSLVSCALPGQGLIRTFPSMLVAPFHFGGLDERFWRAFSSAGLPDWLFPVESVAEGRNHPIVNDFYNRVQPDSPVPYGPWVMPVAIWSIFLGCMFVTLISMSQLLRHQWAVNERLAFPIAQLQASLIQAPGKGRLLNDILGHRLFWIALTAVFVVQSTVALHAYFPRVVPAIPLSFNMSGVMSNEPWVYYSPFVKSATIYFTFIGITYFIQSRISFSLWAIFLIAQTVNVNQRVMQNDIPFESWANQHLGASVAFFAGVMWVGRQHWMRVVQELFGRRFNDGLSFRIPAMTALLGIIGMMVWLRVAGVQWWIGILGVALLLLAHFVVSRIVAETGLPFVRVDGSPAQVYTNLPASWLTAKDVYLTNALTSLGPVASRESLMALHQHGAYVNEATDPEAARRQAWGLMGLVVLALGVGLVVAMGSALYSHYRYAAPISMRVNQPVENRFGMIDRPYMGIVAPTLRVDEGRFPPKSFNPWVHMGIGAGITGALQVMALRSAAWPLMPVGYLLVNSWYIAAAWFSLMLGWLAKVLILKYGGAKMFQSSKPLFVGLIFGEALASGVWLVVSFVLAQNGMDYQITHFLPQ